VTTLTPDLLAHVAAVRDGACDDNELLVLADALDEAANSLPTEYEECPKCVNGWERIRCDWCGRVPDKNGYLEHKRHCHFPNSHHFDENGRPACELVSPCPRDHECTGRLNTPRPNPLRDRAELIRVQVERGRLPKQFCDYECKNRQDYRCRWCVLGDRERDLLARNPAWLSVPCPECDGSGRNEYTLSGNCSLCKGAKDLLKRFVDDRTWATEPSATITRGFLDVTLHRTLCWRAEDLWDKGEPETVPHPVLRAVLASPAGLWVRRVRVDGVEPEASAQHGGWWRWHTEVVPPPVYGLLDGEYLTSHYGRSTQPYWRTAEAATDSLARAVPIWARSAK
jgi:hypothetical protein